MPQQIQTGHKLKINISVIVVLALLLAKLMQMYWTEIFQEALIHVDMNGPTGLAIVSN